MGDTEFVEPKQATWAKKRPENRVILMARVIGRTDMTEAIAEGKLERTTLRKLVDQHRSRDKEKLHRCIVRIARCCPRQAVETVVRSAMRLEEIERATIRHWIWHRYLSPATPLYSRRDAVRKIRRAMNEWRDRLDIRNPEDVTWSLDPEEGRQDRGIWLKWPGEPCEAPL